MSTLRSQLMTDTRYLTQTVVASKVSYQNEPAKRLNSGH